MEFAKELKKNRVLFLMTLPAVILLLVFSYLPMFGIIIAFKTINYQKGILGSSWAGLKNFEYLFKTRDAFIITRNTVLYNFVFIIVGTLAAVFLAIAIHELRNRYLSKTFQSIIMLPHFLSWIVVGYLGYSFLSFDYGLINQVRQLFGFDPINWYLTAGPWPYILVLVSLWKGVGFSSIIYLAALTGISDEYYEAALLDGAGKWQQIRHITIPLIMPQIVLLTLLSIGKIFYSDFGLFYIFTRDSGILTPVTNVIDTYVYRSLITINNVSMSSAAGFYQSIVGFILVLGSNLIVRKIDKEKALF